MISVDILDPVVIGQLREDLPQDAFGAVLATFEDDAARLVDELAAAERAADAVAFRRAAHTLVGAAGALGALRLVNLARRAVVAPSAYERQALMPRITAAAEEARAALRALAAP